MYDQGIYMNDVNPDYVVLGETRTYCFEKLEKAIELVNKGAKLIGCNPDTVGVTEKGIMPATGSLVAPIEIATGKKAYFVGKPNPLMLRHGLKKIGCHSEDIAFIGDRMDTDIIAAIESNIDSILVLSGVTKKEDIDLFPYRPKYVIDGVGDIVKNIARN
jgi:NagD protein